MVPSARIFRSFIHLSFLSFLSCSTTPGQSRGRRRLRADSNETDPLGGSHGSPNCPDKPFNSTTDSRELLCFLLQENRQSYDIIHGSGNFHNHMSYYLVALWRLGADVPRLNKAYASIVAGGTAPLITNRGSINENNWRENIGQFKDFSGVHFQDYAQFYRDWIDAKGVNDLLATVLPEVIDGIPGDVGHAFIETGYAVESNDTSVLADGLAWMSTAYSPLPDMNRFPSRNNTSPIDLLRAIRNDTELPDINPDLDVGVLTRPFGILGGGYSGVLSRYDLYVDEQSDLSAVAKDISNAAFAIFAASGYADFWFVHLMTSSRSLRVLLPHIETGFYSIEKETDSDHGQTSDPGNCVTKVRELQQMACRSMWKFIVYVYVSRGRPELMPPRDRNNGEVDKEMARAIGSSKTWEDLVSRSIAIDDVHVQKVVMQSRDYYFKEDHDPKYSMTATKAVEYFENGADNNRCRWYGEGGPNKSCFAYEIQRTK